MTDRPEDNQLCVLVYGGCFIPNYLPMELFLRACKIPFRVLSDHDMKSFTFQPNHRLFVFPTGHCFGDTPKGAMGGKKGRENLKRAVANGMSYMGICAGAFAATQRSYPPIDIALGLVGMRHRWPNEMGVGVQFLTVKVAPDLARAAGLDQDLLRIWYHNGPILSAGTATDHQVLAAFQPSRAERKMAGAFFLKGKHLLHTPAVVAVRYGNGRVVLCSPHPELGDMGVRDYQSLIRQWLAHNGFTDTEDDPLQPGMPAHRRFMDSLGGKLMEPVRRSQNWKFLSAIVADLVETQGDGRMIP